MLRLKRLLLRAVCLSAWLLPACSDATAPQGSITFDPANLASDTARAQPSQPFAVTVLNKQGAPVIGATVSFDAGSGYRMRGKATDGWLFSPVQVTTDSTGRASVLLSFRCTSGLSTIAVSVPSLHVTGQADVLVNVGAATGILMTPDASLTIGGKDTLAAVVNDYCGNFRTDSINWSTTTPSGVTVTNTGIVTAVGVGKHVVTATHGSLTASRNVTVYPQGKLVVVEVLDNSTAYSINFDGTGRVNRIKTVLGIPAWVPNTEKFIAQMVPLSGPVVLRVVTDTTLSVPFIKAPIVTMGDQVHPKPSANGEFVFFSALDSRCSVSQYCLFRAKSDGTDVQLINVGPPGMHPAPSPDGTKVAFVRSDGSIFVRVLDVTAGTVSAWSVAGQVPAWSPDGTKIAFNQNGRLATMNPDGTGVTVITPVGPSYGGNISWTSDSKYLVSKENNSSHITVVDAVTGVGFGLTYSGYMYNPVVK